MSLSIIALVPIYRANKSTLLQMKPTGLGTYVCSQVTGHGNTLVSKTTLQDNLSKTQLHYCFPNTEHDSSNKNVLTGLKQVFKQKSNKARRSEQVNSWEGYAATHTELSRSWQQRGGVRHKPANKHLRHWAPGHPAAYPTVGANLGLSLHNASLLLFFPPKERSM